MESTSKKNLDSLLRKVIGILSNSDDRDIPSLLGDGILDEFLQAVAPRKTGSEQTPYQYLSANKHGLQLLALLRHAITHNYSVEGMVNGKTAYVSPDFRQWYDDGVMFLQGRNRFEGLIGLYEDNEVKFAVAARDVASGEEIGPEDLRFLGQNEYEEIVAQSDMHKSHGDLNSAIDHLEAMLNQEEKQESKYQAYFERNPWVFGLQYSKIQSHNVLDDKNIPDFTGLRTRDGSRDILEIKQPFLQIFRKDGQFRSEFLQAWQQVEDYLEFVTSENRYLSERKGLRFENPSAILIIGYDIDRTHISSIRKKEKMNRHVTIMTYNDVLASAKSVAKLVKGLSKNHDS